MEQFNHREPMESNRHSQYIRLHFWLTPFIFDAIAPRLNSRVSRGLHNSEASRRIKRSLHIAEVCPILPPTFIRSVFSGGAVTELNEMGM
jgi:hypothetical protein